MVSDLVDLSRILSGKFHMENEPVDPALPLLRIADHWTMTARGSGVALDCSGLRTGDGTVMADPGRLEQVYANLTDNAIRFSEPGGKVVLATTRLGASWRLSVQDFGVGMSVDEVGQVFEPFVQGDVQPRSGKGLGLGLAIVKSSVEAFGGRVWAESAGPGQGTTFFVELPLLCGESVSAPVPLDPASPRLDGLRVLYVEDETDVALAMQEALRQLGAEVDVANSCDEAVHKLAVLQVDALVTDLNLGSGPDGVALAQALHRMPQHRGVPVIAVSAFGSREDLAQTRRHGFAGHLVKPIGAADVAEALHRVAQRK
jgi:CheY-like chemotaxis protein